MSRLPHIRIVLVTLIILASMYRGAYADQYTSLSQAYDPLRPDKASGLLGNYHEGIVIRPSPKTANEQYIYHTVVIDSRDRDYSKYSDSNDYVITLQNQFRDVVSLELVNLLVAKGESLINKNNNTFSFQETPTQVTSKTYVTADIPEGQYTAGDLLAAVGTAMTSSSQTGTTYTLSQDATGKAVINSAGNFFRVFNGDGTSYLPGNISRTLGFRPGSTSNTGTSAISARGEDYIILEMEGVSNNYGSNDALDGSLAQIVIADIEYGQYKHLRGVDWGRCYVRFNPLLPKLTKFHMRFKRPDGGLYDFGGFENSMVFELKCKFKAMDY